MHFKNTIYLAEVWCIVISSHYISLCITGRVSELCLQEGLVYCKLW